MPKYFTFAEMITSDVATSKGIDNIPDWGAAENLRRLVDMVLEKVRALWGAPLYVNSGYRCESLNMLVGGAKNSQHLRGMAADITTGSVEGNKRLFDMVAQSDIQFDQLIDEKGYQWLHISYDALVAVPRRQILHL